MRTGTKACKFGTPGPEKQKHHNFTSHINRRRRPRLNPTTIQQQKVDQNIIILPKLSQSLCNIQQGKATGSSANNKDQTEEATLPSQLIWLFFTLRCRARGPSLLPTDSTNNSVWVQDSPLTQRYRVREELGVWGGYQETYNAASGMPRNRY